MWDISLSILSTTLILWFLFMIFIFFHVKFFVNINSSMCYGSFLYQCHLLCNLLVWFISLMPNISSMCTLVLPLWSISLFEIQFHPSKSSHSNGQFVHEHNFIHHETLTIYPITHVVNFMHQIMQECGFFHTKGHSSWHVWNKLCGFIHDNAQDVVFIVTHIILTSHCTWAMTSYVRKTTFSCCGMKRIQLYWKSHLINYYGCILFI